MGYVALAAALLLVVSGPVFALKPPRPAVVVGVGLGGPALVVAWSIRAVLAADPRNADGTSAWADRPEQHGFFLSAMSIELGLVLLIVLLGRRARARELAVGFVVCGLVQLGVLYGVAYSFRTVETTPYAQIVSASPTP